MMMRRVCCCGRVEQVVANLEDARCCQSATAGRRSNRLSLDSDFALSHASSARQDYLSLRLRTMATRYTGTRCELRQLLAGRIFGCEHRSHAGIRVFRPTSQCSPAVRSIFSHTNPLALRCCEQAILMLSHCIYPAGCCEWFVLSHS